MSDFLSFVDVELIWFFHGALQMLIAVAVTVSMVFGVPTIKRERESYLSRTLQSLIASLNEDENVDCIIVVMVCEVRQMPGWFLFRLFLFLF